MSTNNKKTVTNKSNTKTTSNSIDLEALQSQITALIAQNANLQAQLQEMQGVKTTEKENYNNVASTSSDVAIVYCSDSLGYAAVSGLELNFTQYGEEFIISRTQFDQLVGKYRTWFDKGILAVSCKNADVASAKGIRTDKELGLDSKTLFSIGGMSSANLEKLWNSLKTKSQKESIVTYFKRKFIEGDPQFMSREKVDLMNRLTGGAFTREQDELSGRIKINPTNL